MTTIVVGAHLSPPSMGNTWSATDTDLLETALAVIVKDRYSTHFFASLTLSLRARYGRNFNGSLYASVKWKHLHSWGLLLVFGYVDRYMAVNITCRNTSLISREKLNGPCSWIQWLFMDSNWLYQIASILFVHTIKQLIMDFNTKSGFILTVTNRSTNCSDSAKQQCNFVVDSKLFLSTRCPTDKEYLNSLKCARKKRLTCTQVGFNVRYWLHCHFVFLGLKSF